ncbi:hypothetical protein [Geobacter sp. SVR]|uniref:hypothetical protein n=1 Tax=Geobacter sp. SVR TaxID=2495594 RepID=UPI00143EFCCC|nr:hypothetical protein [Geobacter sp. SVR]BCS55367.1 hypothetical protein GSVR_36750 [Geobacter sp. SVR]GCF87292.1 hypothetical protein GSbR_38920 [Geobacter sp. SVR]
MARKNFDLQTRLNLIALLVLVVGLAAAAGIHLSAGDSSDSTLVDGFLESKKYTHELRMYGGNASVLADQFSRWFEGLWQGQTLAYTIAVIAVAVSIVLFLAARHSSPDHSREEDRD